MSDTIPWNPLGLQAKASLFGFFLSRGKEKEPLRRALLSAM